MPPIRLPPNLRKRHLNMGEHASPAERQRRAEDSHVKHIMEHPRYGIILAALREGNRVGIIANWFARDGWLTSVTERTFAEYLTTFKRLKAALIDGSYEQDELDKLIDSRRPGVDTVAEVDRLIRLQKARIALDFKHEREMGKLFNTTVKEVEVTGKLLELRGKLTGQLDTHSTTGGHASTDDESVIEAINKAKRDESNHDRLQNLTRQLVSNGAANGGR